jgi:nucleotide-binding universal stress UspA family protein
MTTVLVPLDGSALAERALPYAVALASAAGGKLLLVRAMLPYVYLEDGHTRVLHRHPRAEAELAAAAEDVRAQGVAVEQHVLDGGQAADAIPAAVARLGADLVVMSTHGRGGLGRFLYGSVADAVLRTVTVPVLLVPAACERSWPAQGRLRALVPLDGSDLAGRALAAVRDLARAVPMEAVLARVVPRGPLEGAGLGVPPVHGMPLPRDPREDVAAARAELDDEAARLEGAVDVGGVRVEVGPPAPTIAALAREESADLIVMSTHGRGGLTRMVMGSVTTGLLHRADVPLLVVPARVPADHGLAAGPAAPPPAEPTEPVALSPSELALVQYGLEVLLASGGPDEQLKKPVRALLDRLDEIRRAPAPSGAGADGPD